MENRGIKFAKGGEVDGKKYFTIYRDEEGSVKTEFDNYSDALSDYNEFASDDANISLYEVINGENNLLKENQSSADIEYVELSNGDIVVTLEKIDGKWEEGEVLDGETPYGWGGKRYMGYLKPKDIAQWLSKDYGGYFEIVDQYAKGGGIGFKALSNKVAKRYEGKAVAPKYQGEYGKRYSKSEAKEVGDKVAGKVYWNQQGRKMETGGGVDGKKYYMLFNLSEFKEKPMYNHIATSKQEVLDILLESYESIVGHKMYGNGYTIQDLDESKYKSYINDDYAYVTDNVKEYEYNTEGYKGVSWQKVNDNDSYAQGGGISGLNDLIRG